MIFGQGGKFGGFDLGGKFWGEGLTVGVHFGGVLTKGVAKGGL